MNKICALLFFAASASVVFAETKPQIVTSVHPLQSIIESVVGNDATVFSLMGQDADPHTFELTPSAMRSLYDSSLIILNGLGLEFWEGKLDLSLQQKIVRLSSVLPEERGDMHTWLDPKIVSDQIPIIVESLCEKFNSSCKKFTVRGAVIREELLILTRELQSKVSTWKSKSFAAEHPAWGRFAARLGLSVPFVLEETEDVAPSPARIETLMKLAKEGKVSVLVLDSRSGKDALSSLVRDAGLKRVFLDELGKADERYQDLILRNVSVLEGAMKD